MKEYLLSLLGCALVLAVIGVLSPEGERGGIVRHVRLIAALVWICVLIAPLPTLSDRLSDWWEDLSISQPSSDQKELYEQALDQALNEASCAYFSQQLTRMVCEQFEIDPGNLRCAIQWESDAQSLRPTQITILLSGKAIWKSPYEIQAFVQELIGCEVVTVIE